MTQSIRCTNPRCSEAFSPSAEQAQFIAQSAAKGMTFIMLECPACGQYMRFNPLAPGGIVETKPALQLRCPTRACAGWVSHVDTFWGCGECGEVWPNRKALDRAITKIVRQHPYRAACYQTSDAGWLPAPCPPDYEEQVRDEWT